MRLRLNELKEDKQHTLIEAWLIRPPRLICILHRFTHDHGPMASIGVFFLSASSSFCDTSHHNGGIRCLISLSPPALYLFDFTLAVAMLR
jgi:hypothetical protein